MVRAFVFSAGCIGLGCATWLIIVSNGYAGPDAGAVIALAVMTAAGAIAVAKSRWYVGAALLLIVMVCEASGMLATSERVIRNREALSRAEASKRPEYAAAQAGYAAAQKAITDHDTRAAATLATPSCGKECRGNLEVTRASLLSDRDAASKRLGLVPGKHPSAMADWLGVEARTLDIVAALMSSVGLNLFAAVLIAWGAHAPKAVTKRYDPKPETILEAAAPVREPKMVKASNVVPMPRRASTKDAEKFVMDALKPAEGAISVKAIADAYWRYCETKGIGKPDAAETVNQLASVFARIRVETEMAPGREVMVRGVALTG